MGNKTKVNGTVYEVAGGKCKVNGTGYSIEGGKTKVGGTDFNISFFPKPVWNALGDVITWDDKQWLVCHYDSALNQVYLIAENIISETIFGSNAFYKNSTLASVANDYQNNQMSTGALSRCVNVTVPNLGSDFDVTAKVFVPSYEQMKNGGFSWFNSDSRRKAKYKSTYTAYYESSPVSTTSTTSVRVVSVDGVASAQGMCTGTRGFRPCVCVQM